MDEGMKKILYDHERRMAKLEALFTVRSIAVQKEFSPKEFILSKKPKGDVRMTLVLGYYLEKNRDLLAFNIKDLENAFREAKESVPDNINYKVVKNVEKGHMMEAKEKKDNLKAWNLTASGEKFVENNLKEGHS